MNKIKRLFFLAAFLVTCLASAAENEHKEDHDGGHKDEAAAHSDTDQDSHEEQEENPQIGPDKGITEYREHDGFKLSPEAFKNFEIVTIDVGQGEILILDEKVIVKTGVEQNLFRLRNDFFKRVDFTLVNRSAGKIQIKSTELRPGDKIVVQGMGFLRISEISATGGAPEGHSH